MEVPITLFTGDTIPSLLSIASVGRIERQVDSARSLSDFVITRRLTLTIHLKEGARLEYVAIEQQLRAETPHDLQRWESALEQLKAEKLKLVEAWGLALEEGGKPGRSTLQNYPVGQE